MRYRITLTNETTDLRGSMDAKDVRAFADAVKPLGMMVIASPLPEEDE